MDPIALSSLSDTKGQLLSIFGVDVGNHDTKSRHSTFVSGFDKSMVVNNLSKEYLEFQNADEKTFYTSMTTPFNYSLDKTKTEDMFILTLMSIAKEAIARRITLCNGENIVLAIGMPPGMFNAANISSYEKYYKDRSQNISFSYLGVPFRFNIKRIAVSAQCWGTVVGYSHLAVPLNEVYIFDIGGITIDTFRLRKGVIVDGSIDSYEEGVNKMFAIITKTLRQETGIRFKPEDIKNALMGKENLPNSQVQRIKDMSYAWTRDIFTKMLTEGAEFRITPVITCGGGSLLLDDEITRVADELNFFKKLSIKDNKANAIGYEIIAAKGLLKLSKEEIVDFWSQYDHELAS